MKEKFNANINVIVFSIINFITALICLFVLPTAVPISIASGFRVGEMGSKWILLIFIFLGLILGGLCFLGKQITPEQKAFAKKRQIGINILISFWTMIIYFYIGMFNSIGIIGARVNFNVVSMVVILLACLMSLFSKEFMKGQTGEGYHDFRLAYSVFTSEVCGYVLLIVGAVNIFIDMLVLTICIVIACGLTIYLLPLVVTKYLKKQQEEKKEEAKRQSDESDEKLQNAFDFATSTLVEENLVSKETKTRKAKAENAVEKTEQESEENTQPVELAEEKVVTKTQAKKLAKQSATKNAQKQAGNKPAAKSKTAPAKKQTAKKATKSSSNYKGVSKTKTTK